VIALKYAQEYHGADRTVAERLVGVGIRPDTLQPPIGDHRYVVTNGGVAAQHALFIGVAPIFELDYPDMRAFGNRVLAVLAIVDPSVRHVAMTIHGPGFGLDEVETFLAQVEGILDAMRAGHIPDRLERITIVDRSGERVARLRAALIQRLERASFAAPFTDGAEVAYHISVRLAQGVDGGAEEVAGVTGRLEAGDAEKSHAFVAMPFNPQMNDIFYYGIQAPVHAAGLLCERLDKVAFTGEIIERLKHKIETATVVIAELTDNNPNVYLEVGYAWGRGRPTILLTSNTGELPFDVRGHRRLVYDSIRHLETILQRELRELHARKLI
jgi:hypothetical protein